MSLRRTLKEQEPIERVKATCGVCEAVLYDSRNAKDEWPSCAKMASLIRAYAKKHHGDSGHEDLQIALDKRTPVREIDATITVNE